MPGPLKSQERVKKKTMNRIHQNVPFTPEFKANRPFVFLIREKSTGSILFMGRMTEPVAN